MLETLSIDNRVRFKDPSEELTVPKVVRVNSFTEEAAAAFSAEMSEAVQTGQKVIPVVIDSNGGDPYSLFAMIDVIDSCPVPVATVIEGKAFSCGAALFCCGAAGLRFIGPNATLMIHDTLAGDEEFKKTKEVMADALETSRVNKRIYRLIDSHIGKKAGYTWDLVQARSRTDWYMNARQAVKFGYADKVAIPKMSCTVKVEMELVF